LVLYAAVEIKSGIKTVLKESEARSPEAKLRFEIGDVLPESGQNRFLTLGAERAEQLGLCEGVFESEADMLASLNIGDIQRTRMNWVDRTVYLLNRPWLTAILLIVGLVGMYLELAAPGLSVAGLLAALCFGIFFWSHALGGTSGWLEVLLFALGIACLFCELFVLPGFGVFGIAGVGLVVVSLVMAGQSFVVPSTATEWSLLQTNSLVVLGCVLGVFVLLIGQVLLLDSLPGLNRFRLPVTEIEVVGESAWAGSLASDTRPQSTVAMGDRGVAESDLRPSGKVIIGGNLADVVTEGDYVDAGSQVQVVRIDGNRVVVRKTFER
jgi:membrane-bound serine protease (ClpP class)